MGIFTDFYNTVARFFRQQDEHSEGDNSKSVATNRLKLVLMQDRTNLTPKILEQMRSELIDLLSKYVELDKELLELNFEHEGDQVALMLSIPVIRAKDEEEIELALKKEDDNSDELDDADEVDDEISETSDLEIENEQDANDSQSSKKNVTTPDGISNSDTESSEAGVNENNFENTEA